MYLINAEMGQGLHHCHTTAPSSQQESSSPHLGAALLSPLHRDVASWPSESFSRLRLALVCLGCGLAKGCHFVPF